MTVSGIRPPKAILFDLDGTLIDSAPDITAAVNELLAIYGLPPLSLPQVTAMIGRGVRVLIDEAFAASGMALDGAALDKAERVMAPIYLRHLTGRTRLMPGASEAIAELHAEGIAMAVVTNKPERAAREVLSHFGLVERMGAVVGGDAVSRKKPAPDGLFMALERLGHRAIDTVMVGDSGTDVTAARAAGMPVVLVRGGYTRVPLEELGADLVCDSLHDLPHALNALNLA
ncbi:phosphoglycolate phosphatase [Pseudaminobacter sp. 19-2017]|uniref:Phosphoglycolate phosphatase n=1 Tax=Pseudaminobacter soli (ex Zhang et al. 2022) TaxID=2831468 RepID=A0A942DWX5_9HYPH|nr:phosphoglycolate phosphatase [Pseudaminobacter soli]